MDARAMLQKANEIVWSIHRPVLDAALSRVAAGAGPPDTPAAAAPAPTSRSIAIVPIQGVLRQKAPIGMYDMMFGGCGASTEAIGAAIRSLVADEEIAAIILDIDSPGGEVYGMIELADVIFEARENKPIIAVANSTAFSAAYGIGSQASEVVVTPGGEVGSIGVWMLHADFSEFDKKAGVQFTYISAGKYKVEGNMEEPLSDEARELMQADVDRYYGMFVSAVARGRDASPTEVRKGFGEGWTVGAKEAVKLGMADRVGTLRETIERFVGRRGKAGASAAEDLDLRQRRLRQVASR